MEVQKNTSETAASIITLMKAVFVRHWIPAVLASDNGIQYDNRDMKEFVEKYRFHHITSSPYHSQSNGQAERAIKTAKQLLASSPDPCKKHCCSIEQHPCHPTDSA